jgi:hypothetical protein
MIKYEQPKYKVSESDKFNYSFAEWIGIPTVGRNLLLDIILVNGAVPNIQTPK